MILAKIGATLLAGAPHRRAILCTPAGAATPTLLAKTFGAAGIFDHPIWPEGVLPENSVPIVLAADDRDDCPRQSAIWPGAGPRQPRRWRRIDTLYAASDIGLIVLADPASAAPVLHGAAELLAACRPAVLLDLRDAADPAALRNSIAPLLPGYRWAEPSKAIVCATPPEMDAPHRIYPDPPAPLRTKFDDSLVCLGLHPTEPNAPQGGRWTGIRLAPWVILPRPTPGRWKLRLEIADWGNAEEGFVVQIETGPKLPPRLVPDWAEYGPFTIAPSGAVLRVTLFPPRPIADQIRWPRRIGLRIACATLVPA